MKIVPLFGASTASKSYVVTRQRRLNVYFEIRKDGDKTKIACYGTPGLVAAFTASAASLTFPARGFLGTQDNLYLVNYNKFQAFDSSGTAVSSAATIATAAGSVSMAYSPTQVMLVDGNAAYYYTIATGVTAAVGSFTATGAKTITFVAGFFVSEQPGTQKFWVSNAYDGSTWNALAFATASSDSDNILAVDNLNGNLLLFMQQGMEFWQNTGATPEPFAPILSASNRFGLAAIFSRAHVGESLIFLAQSPEGQIQFAKATGYSVKVISDPDIESIINGFSKFDDAVAYSYQVDSHPFYQVSFPTEDRSFLYDLSTDLWSDVQTGASIVPTRHRGGLSAFCNGQTFVADYATNQVYTIDPNTYTDNGEIIAREVITRHVLSNFNRIRISALYLDMETGVGLQSGQGSSPMVMLQYSKDNGRTWSAERWASLGQVGQYMTRVIWRRFGSTRDAVFKIRMTDPVKFVITEGAMKLSTSQVAAKRG
jgi:hypothetical protein